MHQKAERSSREKKNVGHTKALRAALAFFKKSIVAVLMMQRPARVLEVAAASNPSTILVYCKCIFDQLIKRKRI